MTIRDKGRGDTAGQTTEEKEGKNMVDIPGIGSKEVTNNRGGFGEVQVVELSAEEIKKITSWPFDDIYPVIAEMGSTMTQLDYPLSWAMHPEDQDASFEEDDDENAESVNRWDRLCGHYSKAWSGHQRQKNWPKEEEVNNPRKENPPGTPVPISWGRDLVTGEELFAYAALKFDRASWSISWHKSKDEAAKVNSRARTEARQYVESRELETRLTAEAEMLDLPTEIPEFVDPEDSPETILNIAGLNKDEYRFIDNPYWYQKSSPAQQDPDDGDWSQKIAAVASLAKKNSDGVWEIGTVGKSDLFERHSLGDYNDEANTWSVIEQILGEGEAKAVQDKLKKEQEKAKNEYRTRMQSFVDTLGEDPIFEYLSTSYKTELRRIADSDSLVGGFKSTRKEYYRELEDNLKEEWRKASVLRERREEKGDILVNHESGFERVSNNGRSDSWVIGSDGYLRPANIVSCQGRSPKIGKMEWRVVGPDELAISILKHSLQSDNRFRVDKIPTDGCTEQQQKAVRAIEKTLRGFFDNTKKGDKPNRVKWDLDGEVASEPAKSLDKQEKPVAAKTEVKVKTAPEAKLTIAEADPETKARLHQAIEDIRSLVELLDRIKPDEPAKGAKASKQLTNILKISKNSSAALERVTELFNTDSADVNKLNKKVASLKRSIELAVTQLTSIEGQRVARLAKAWQQAPEVVRNNEEIKYYVDEGETTLDVVIAATREWLFDNRKELGDDMDWEAVMDEVANNL